MYNPTTTGSVLSSRGYICPRDLNIPPHYADFLNSFLSHADFAIVAKTQYSARILGAVFIRGAINKHIRM